MSSILKSGAASAAAEGATSSLSMYNSFTDGVVRLPEIAHIVGDMLCVKDLLSIEACNHATRSCFLNFLSQSHKERHKELVFRSKPSVIFHNLFSSRSSFINTVVTLIQLYEKGIAFNEAGVFHQGALTLVQNAFEIIDSASWDLSAHPDILGCPDLLDVFASRDFKKLMLANPDSKTVFFTILPHYITDWDNGGDNNITDIIGPSLKSDEQVARSLLSLEPHFFYDLSEGLQARKDLLILACKAGVEDVYIEPQMFLDNLDPSWLNDFDVMKTICERHGRALSFASSELRDNKELVIIALKNCNEAFIYASDRLKDDEEIAALSILKNPDFFARLSPRLRADLQISELAFSKDPKSLAFCLNIEFILSVVSEDLSVFDNVRDELKSDFEFMRALCLMNENAIVEPSVLSKELYESREFALSLVEVNPLLIRCLHPFCLVDLEIVALACTHNPKALIYVTNKDIILKVVQINRQAALFIHDNLRRNALFMHEVMKLI
jgi:Domain of unknown function (DUF4116)